jgi:uncharacterized membrane protein
MIGPLLIILGIISFFTGYFYVAKAQGQNDCTPKPDVAKTNRIGGIFGIVIGILFFIAAFMYKAKTKFSS